MTTFRQVIHREDVATEVKLDMLYRELEGLRHVVSAQAALLNRMNLEVTQVEEEIEESLEQKFEMLEERIKSLEKNVLNILEKLMIIEIRVDNAK
jgi:hypothetical protein